MCFGALFGLWGRRKAIRTVEQRVPPRFLDAVSRTVGGFIDEVNAAQEESRRAATRAASIEVDARVREADK